jgi:hypothetical protein
MVLLLLLLLLLLPVQGTEWYLPSAWSSEGAGEARSSCCAWQHSATLFMRSLHL